MKILPESCSDFSTIRTQDLVYIDKTEYIQKYEALDSYVSLLLRPRRFGKTMFTEILRYYYDSVLSVEFDEYFEGTWIHSNPTPLRGRYCVLKFDFSGIRNLGGVEDTINFFMSQVSTGIRRFYKTHPEFLPFVSSFRDGERMPLWDVVRFYNDRSEFTSPAMMLSRFLSDFDCLSVDQEMMVIIDEYDNFTNDILSRDPGTFSEIARKDGEIGSFYNVLRNFNQQGVVKRIFVTGVMPVTMDTAVSGFVCTRISNFPELNCLAGFTADDVLELIREAVDPEVCKFSPQELLYYMKAWYDGYRFSRNCEDTVFNPALCMSFIRTLVKDGAQTIPELDLSSVNDVDYMKLTGYLNLVGENDRNEIVNAILCDMLLPVSFPSPVRVFSGGRALNRNEGASILFHLGFLTLASKEEISESGGNLGRSYLKVPNAYFKMLFSRYYFQERKVSWAVFDGGYDLSGLARKNDLSLLLRMLEGIAQAFVNTDNTRQGEAQVALAVYTVLTMNTGSAFSLTREYAVRHGGKYVMAGDATLEGEPDQQVVQVDTHSGRADLVAENIKGLGPSYLFEFKYARDAPARDETKEKVRAKLIDEACRQLAFYVTDDHLKTIPDLRKYVIMYTYGQFLMQEIE